LPMTADRFWSKIWKLNKFKIYPVWPCAKTVVTQFPLRTVQRVVLKGYDDVMIGNWVTTVQTHQFSNATRQFSVASVSQVSIGYHTMLSICTLNHTACQLP